MAKVDYEYWANGNTDPEGVMTLAMLGVIVAALMLPLNRRRLKRNDRSDQERRARIAATGKRGTRG
jgi:hypothetical protein